MTNNYKPVVSASIGDYTGKALVGTYSCILGWTMDKSLRTGLKGFAIKRQDFDRETGELLSLKWLGSFKRFKTHNAGIEEMSSLQAPFQRFRWNDYSLKPDKTYLYEIFPMRGTPGQLLREEPPLRFKVVPSLEDQDGLGVYVNRGVTSAMAYLNRFKNRKPSEVGPSAYSWLSRGLKESLIKFIKDTSPGQALHVAIYEFFDLEIAQCFRDAIDRGVAVRIVHDARKGKNSTKKNEKVIRKFQLGPPITIPRTTVNISHNKLVIRLVNGVPTEIWAGSANFSENAFNFQTNSALMIREPKLCKYYEAYFQGLLNNPAKRISKEINRKLMNDANVEANRYAEKTFFSPLKEEDILDCSADIISSARSAVFISAPFGLDERMVKAIDNNSEDIIEYGLVNSTAKRRIEGLNRRNTRFFTPYKLKTYMGRNWDAKSFGAHKIHSKIIVTDPWSSTPQILIGSANFSKNSCVNNDENALYIKGDKRLAAILATEFMRMYDHYKARFYINLLGTNEIFLSTDESWSKTSFDPNSSSHKFRDRIVFSGG